jgi:hypothetical protein
MTMASLVCERRGNYYPLPPGEGRVRETRVPGFPLTPAFSHGEREKM